MLTITQFAAKVRLSRQRIHQLIREGRVSPPPKRVGNYFLLPTSAKIIKPLTTVK